MKKRTEKIFMRLITAMLLLYALNFYMSEIAPFQGQKFDKTEWLNPHYTAQYSCSSRGPMIADLKQNYLKHGIEKTIVIELLGDARYSLYEEYKNCLSYNLGTCSGAEPDGDDLVVCFDTNDRLTFSKRIFHSA